MYGYVHANEGVWRGEQRVVDLVGAARWMLGTEAGSSGGVVSVHEHWAISPAPLHTMYNLLLSQGSIQFMQNYFPHAF